MRKFNGAPAFLGLIAGTGITACAALLMGQGAQPGTTPSAQPPQTTYPNQSRAGEYFVTGDGSTAHLWVREGMNLRHVADADTTRTPGTTPRDRDNDKDGKPPQPK